jgi:hypothetical protein
MRYRIPTNGVRAPLGGWRHTLGFFFPRFPVVTVLLTRYVYRMRELRKDVSSDCSRPSPPHNRLYQTSTNRYGRFSRSIRPDEVGESRQARA